MEQRAPRGLYPSPATGSSSAEAPATATAIATSPPAASAPPPPPAPRPTPTPTSDMASAGLSPTPEGPAAGPPEHAASPGPEVVAGRARPTGASKTAAQSTVAFDGGEHAAPPAAPPVGAFNAAAQSAVTFDDKAQPQRAALSQVSLGGSTHKQRRRLSWPSRRAKPNRTRNSSLMLSGPVSPDSDATERYYEDAVDDPTMNSQPLEVYLYYAALEREREAMDTRPIPDAPWTVMIKRCIGRRDKIVHAHEPAARPAAADVEKDPRSGRLSRVFRRRGRPQTEVDDPIVVQLSTASSDPDEKTGSDNKVGLQGMGASTQSVLTPCESQTAYRLLRVASWQVVFYLITTDMLGWYTAPYAFTQLGFGPGVLVYVCFYLLAMCSGQILWRLYLSLDSERYPVKCYADLGQRTFGTWVKHAFNVLQSIQLLFNVAMLLIMDGQALAQIIDFKFCYIALTIFFALLCMGLSQFKTLRGLSWFTNINLWVNLIVMALTMVGTALFDPVPAQSGHTDLSEPIIRSGWVPSYTHGWYQQIVGVQIAVFAYGGAMIFTEFMAEMRRPRDFWKAAIGAQTLCVCLYLLFGLFVYAYQGQYTAILPTVNIAEIIFQGVTNILGLICICVIAVLYAHIGCKVFYRNVLRGYLHAPSLTSSKSNLPWLATVIGYFALAWVLGSAIPNIADLNTIVGAACILQFTYTFPPFLLVGHWVQRDALAGDQAWEPGVEPWSNRVDTWRDVSRWKRGFRRYWYLKLGLILATLSCLALCALGIYSGVLSAKESFASGYSSSFSCRAPGQPQDE